MTTPPDDDSQPQFGTIADGHVLTAAGWIRLNHLPENASPPYYPGDVKRDHVFTGSDWAPVRRPVPLPSQAPSVSERQPSLEAPSKSSVVPWLVGPTAIVIVVGIIVAALSGGQQDTDPADAQTANSASASPSQSSESNSPTAEPKPKPKKSAPPPDPNRYIVEGMWIHDNFQCTYNEFASTVTGTITNQSGSSKSYVSISFGLYDASGALLGTALANVNNLGSGVDWKYEAIGMVGEFARCEVGEVMAY